MESGPTVPTSDEAHAAGTIKRRQNSDPINHQEWYGARRRAQPDRCRQAGRAGGSIYTSQMLSGRLVGDDDQPRIRPALPHESEGLK
jgi:hypothetical protein